VEALQDALLDSKPDENDPEFDTLLQDVSSLAAGQSRRSFHSRRASVTGVSKRLSARTIGDEPQLVSRKASARSASSLPSGDAIEDPASVRLEVTSAPGEFGGVAMAPPPIATHCSVSEDPAGSSVRTNELITEDPPEIMEDRPSEVDIQGLAFDPAPPGADAPRAAAL